MNLLRTTAVVAAASSLLFSASLSFAAPPLAESEEHAPTATAPPAPRATSPAAKSPYHLDLETDPTAFVFSGGSLHAGLGYKHLRLDLGAYAMDVPGFIESNKGFDGSFRGFGAKLQLFLFAEQKGGFVGIDAGVTEIRATAHGTGRSSTQVQLGAGVNFGWRFELPLGFYVTPWLGLGYSSAPDVEVDGQTYESSPVTIFPAVHVGFRFL